MKTFEANLYKGTIQDAYGNPVAVGPTKAMVKTEKGFSTDDSFITYTNSILPSTGAFTFVAIARNLGNKKSPLATNTATTFPGIYNWFSSTAGQTYPLLWLGSDGGANSTFRYFNYTPDNEWHMYIFTMPGDAIADINNSALYVDGFSKATVTTQALYAQSRDIKSIAGNSANKTRNVAYVAVYNEVISTQEINRLTDWFYELKASTLPKSNFVNPKPTDLSYLKDKGLVGAYNFIKGPNRTLVDISGSGDTATIGSYTSTTNNGISLSQLANSKIEFTKTVVTNTESLQFTIKIGDVTASTTLYQLMTYQVAGYRVFVLSDGRLQIQTHRAGASTITTLQTLAENTTYTIQLLIDNTNSTIKSVVNGVDTDYAITAYVTSTSVTGPALGDFSGGTVSTPCELIDFRKWNRILTETEYKEYHNNWAKQLALKDCMCDYPADGVTKSILDNYDTVGGTYKVGEITTATGLWNKGQKYIECVTAGDLNFNFNKPYFQIEFDIYKSVDSNLFLRLYNSARSSATASLNGYIYGVTSAEELRLYKTVAGSSSVISGSATGYISANTVYRLKLLRSVVDDKFYCYIKGSQFGNEYVLLDVTGGNGTNPVTDATYKSFNYGIFSLMAGDRIANINITNDKTV